MRNYEIKYILSYSDSIFGRVESKEITAYITTADPKKGMQEYLKQRESEFGLPKIYNFKIIKSEIK